MATFYYKDEDIQYGPFDEKTVLEKYNAAEFTSDVTFQIRSSATDDSAPFVMLRDLIVKNGPSNPFCDDFEDIDKRIAEAEKELEELRKIANKKSELEQKINNIQKFHVEITKDYEGFRFEDFQPSTSGMNKGEENTKTEIMIMCNLCKIVFANSKQYLMHINQPCLGDTSKELKNLKRQFEDDLGRWKEEDAARLSMGRSLLSKMSTQDRGSARPQTDFFDDIGTKLKKNMPIGTETGIVKSMEFLKSGDGEKIKERLEKHLRDAKGNLVCNKCNVACKTHIHFIIHLTTFDHRFKVKDTPWEMVSLLLGWYHAGLYLSEADPSELDENIEPDPTSTLAMSSLRLAGN